SPGTVLFWNLRGQDQVPSQTGTKSQAFPKHYQSALYITAGM
ncbi:MAG: hypothetical protein ACI805_001297, partial [Candidatus Azotimanducaceae bacterium]